MPPKGKRIFATFKPNSSPADMDTSTPSFARRVVVELEASGEYVCRFVPLADRAPGEEDTGWPRMVDVRGCVGRILLSDWFS